MDVKTIIAIVLVCLSAVRHFGSISATKRISNP